MPEREIKDGLLITTDMIEAFLEELEKKERSSSCIESYRNTLLQLYAWMPEEKLLSKELLQEWREWQVRKAYSARTINSRMSAINHFLRYKEQKGWCMDNYFRMFNDKQPELTRNEYRRLLQAAKQLEKEKTYLLIKSIGGAGIKVQDLPLLTVEAVERGRIQIQEKGRNVNLYIPKDLRQELLSYAKRKGIKRGSLFATHSGEPLNRSSVWQYIKSVSRDAQVPAEKATPRCLWKMYQHTYQKIEADITNLVEQAYARMLEEEQQVVGWEV